jgi:hypothetical protein
MAGPVPLLDADELLIVARDYFAGPGLVRADAVAILIDELTRLQQKVADLIRRVDDLEVERVI